MQRMYTKVQCLHVRPGPTFWSRQNLGAFLLELPLTLEETCIGFCHGS